MLPRFEHECRLQVVEPQAKLADRSKLRAGRRPTLHCFHDEVVRITVSRCHARQDA